MAGRDTGIHHLRTYWWNLTPMSVLGLTSFQDALAYYDRKSPEFVKSIGDIAAGIQQTKVKEAFAKVAKENGSGYPAVGAFYDALSAGVRTISSRDVKDIAAGTVSDIGSAAAWGLGGLVTLALIGGVAYLAIMSGGVSKGLKAGATGARKRIAPMRRARA
ncbi:MAG: hypothetical protein AB7F66_17695 [Bacteriovoracia bacterium]